MFSSKLRIIGDGTLNFKKIARVVYKTLSQKDKLLAEVVFVSEDEIRALNNERRGIDKVTDVLSFPTLDGAKGKVLRAKDFPYDCINGRLNIGSIAICALQGAKQAKEYGHGEEREYTYLVVHGLMHLFGYDHTTDEDKAEMRSFEKKIIKILKLGDEE
jgi:probable rRNA maturation factor